MRRLIACVLLLPVLFISGCQFDRRQSNLLDLSLLADGQPHLTERVPYQKWLRGDLKEIPDPGSMGFDLRSYDVSTLDLSAAETEFEAVIFDTHTVWPKKLCLARHNFLYVKLEVMQSRRMEGRKNGAKIGNGFA